MPAKCQGATPLKLDKSKDRLAAVSPKSNHLF
jgi:hypothetical protein